MDLRVLKEQLVLKGLQGHKVRSDPPVHKVHKVL